MTKVRVHVASICGSWETEPLLLEQARAYGQQLKKKQPLHSVTLRGFADGHYEEIPKQETRKVRKTMAFRKITSDFEGWASPQEGKTLVGTKVGEKTTSQRGQDKTWIIVELLKQYDCTPTESDEDDEKLVTFEPGQIVAITANYALSEIMKYETITFAVKWLGKKSIGGGQKMWKAELAVDDDKPMVRKQVNKPVTQPKAASDDDIPF